MTGLVLNATAPKLIINGVAFTSYADRYLEAATTVMNSRKLDGKFDPIPYQLLCQSFELNLKAFIWLIEKKSNSTIKNKYGHDIEKLWRHCKDRGIKKYAAVTPLRDRVISLLGPYYKDRMFCYLDIDMIFGGFVNLKSEPLAISTMARLNRQLSKKLRQPIIEASNN